MSVTDTIEEIADETGISAVFGPVIANFTLQKLLYVIVLIAVCMTVVKLLLRLVDRFLKNGKIEPSLHTFIRTAARILLWFLAVVIVVGSLGVNITSLIAVLSVVGLAVSLAVQGVLSNFAGSVQLLMAKPFKVGDYIQANGIEGVVEEITMVNTRIRTGDNKMVFVPNSELSVAKVTNFTAQPRRRVDLTFQASYDDKPADVTDAIRAVVASHAKILADPAPFVRLSAYRDSSIEYAVRVWCATEDYWTVYFDLLEQIKVAFDEKQIEMTYNHLNVHMVSKG